MAKLVPDAQLDAMLTILANSNKVVICSTQPTTYTEANATYALGAKTITAGTAGAFTLANGDTDGRKITMAQQTAVSITATGSAQHIALVDTTTSSLRAVTTCTTQAVTSGNTATINAFDIELSDAV